MTRDEMIEALKKGRVNVTFTKKDGTERKMTCTLQEDRIPPVFLNGTEQFEHKTRKQNLDVIPVFDLDIQEWRSFRVDSVKKFKSEKRKKHAAST
jgi:hypothetical protein